jgi:hypothetical protein
MKFKCSHCRGKLGLGVRFRRLWMGSWWQHLRFCSKRCEESYETEVRSKNRQLRWHSLLGSTAQ